MSNPRHDMPDFNPNSDAGSIPGFRSGTWYGERPGEIGKVFEDAGDSIYTHLHKHPDGLTISTKYPDGHVDRYNFNTGGPD